MAAWLLFSAVTYVTNVKLNFYRPDALPVAQPTAAKQGQAENVKFKKCEIKDRRIIIIKNRQNIWKYMERNNDGLSVKTDK